ncbi:MAG: hypothetical protein F4X64_13050 [Chloroflexi bacterium]|nr:hypothetical protein [Chloroflexota bacterium]
MVSERTFHLYGDNIVECERTLHIIERALAGEQIYRLGMGGTPANPVFRLAFRNRDERFSFAFFPGFGRWNTDVLQFVRGVGLREAPDIVIAEVIAGSSKPLMSVEYSGALAAGNQAWQRSGRAYAHGRARVPYLYVTEIGGQELGVQRDRRASRYPNPAVPFSYLCHSTTSRSVVLPVFVPNPGLTAEGRARFAGVLGEEELEGLVRAIILSEDSDLLEELLSRKVLEFVALISDSSTRGRTLKSEQWRDAYEAIAIDHNGFVDYLLTQERIRWSKRISAKLDVTSRLRRLLAKAAEHGRGLTSESLPFCLLEVQGRMNFASEVQILYPHISNRFIEWLRKERPLAVCWLTGYKPRGDDSRPDRGLPPFAKMLVGDGCDLLSVVYGPGNPEHWRRLVDDPNALVANGLWEAIIATSDAILIDSVTDYVSTNGYLRSHWVVADQPEIHEIIPAETDRFRGTRRRYRNSPPVHRTK